MLLDRLKSLIAIFSATIPHQKVTYTTPKVTHTTPKSHLYHTKKSPFTPYVNNGVITPNKIMV
jgi:hypothetical protein